MCAVTNQQISLAGCDVSERNLYLRYLNDDSNVKVGFVIAVGGRFLRKLLFLYIIELFQEKKYINLST